MLVRIPHALLLRACIWLITNNIFCDLLERSQGQRVREDARQRQTSAMVQEDSGEKEG